MRSVNVEVLVSTMNSKDMSIYDDMNITSDAIIINQCDKNDYEEKVKDNKLIRMYSFNEKGVGKSRNNALMRSTGDICMMADDDMVYVDGYEDIVINAFKANPNVDMIVFNVRVHNNNGTKERVKKNQRVRFYNCLKYGTVTFAFRRKKVYQENIFFSLLFGGGAKYGAGEDSLFIWDCIKKGLKVYSNKNVIADVYNYDSTWFKGYNKKYFIDKGALFAALSKRFSSLLILQFAIRRRKMYRKQVSVFDAIKFMFMGAREYYNYH